jgi:hypothetical protein
MKDKIKIISKTRIYDENGTILIDKDKIYEARIKTEISGTYYHYCYEVLINGNTLVEIPVNKIEKLEESRDKKINKLLNKKRN